MTPKEKLFQVFHRNSMTKAGQKEGLTIMLYNTV